MTMLTETRERFLLAIAAQVPAEGIAEIHFFQPMKQSGVESGVAVVVGSGPLAVDRDQPESEAPAEDAAVEPEASILTDDGPRPTVHGPRIVVYTARYRLTLKGIDRGKWETNVVAEADAPIGAVDAVVRGVQRRAGDVDDATRMEGDEARTLLEALAAAHPIGR
jgi:hypothetical protein